MITIPEWFPALILFELTLGNKIRWTELEEESEKFLAKYEKMESAEVQPLIGLSRIIRFVLHPISNAWIEAIYNKKRKKI